MNFSLSKNDLANFFELPGVLPMYLNFCSPAKKYWDSSGSRPQNDTVELKGEGEK